VISSGESVASFADSPVVDAVAVGVGVNFVVGPRVRSVVAMMLVVSTTTGFVVVNVACSLLQTQKSQPVVESVKIRATAPTLQRQTRNGGQLGNGELVASSNGACVVDAAVGAIVLFVVGPRVRSVVVVMVAVMSTTTGFVVEAATSLLQTQKSQPVVASIKVTATAPTLQRQTRNGGQLGNGELVASSSGACVVDNMVDATILCVVGARVRSVVVIVEVVVVSITALFVVVTRSCSLMQTQRSHPVEVSVNVTATAPTLHRHTRSGGQVATGELVASSAASRVVCVGAATATTTNRSTDRSAVRVGTIMAVVGSSG